MLLKALSVTSQSQLFNFSDIYSFSIGKQIEAHQIKALKTKLDHDIEVKHAKIVALVGEEA